MGGRLPLGVSGPYDCIKLMMLGIHQFMASNQQFTPEMLANGSLNHLLTPDKFANTGYNGVQYQPIELDNNGDFIVFYDNRCHRKLLQVVTKPANILRRVKYPTSRRPCGSRADDKLEFSSRHTSCFPLCIGNAVFAYHGNFVDQVSQISSYKINVTQIYGNLYTWNSYRKLVVAVLYWPSIVNCVFSASSLKKGIKRLVKDDVLLGVLALIVGVAIILLAMWQKQTDVQGFHTSYDKSYNHHVCQIKSSTNTPALAAMIGYIGFLIASTGLLSYLTISIYDSLSEASFLSFSFIMGIVAFAVTLATNYSFETSVTTLVLQNLVIWVAANVSILALYLPKLMEAVSEYKEKQDLGMANLPSASLFSDTERRYSIKSVISAGSLYAEESHKDNTAEHMNLRGAYITFKKSWWGWSKWTTCGVTLFKSRGKKWIVFEMGDMSIACLANEKASVQSSLFQSMIPIQRLELAANGDERYFGCVLEFDNAEKKNGFAQSLEQFLL
ncbi:hypothetical protein HDU76_001607 [Blyttiomyces sp. JEL0837]|nr:hypothetical protein HDU76_001607 [Blyttiomyces sp. JEL0837]